MNNSVFYVRQPSCENHWQKTVDDINQLAHEHEHRVTEQYKDITRRHWQSTVGVKQCPVCRKNFGLFDRPTHCRRCGQVFCKQCTSYERRLNNCANFDPTGQLCKVCQKCFDVGPQSLGQTRDHFQSLFLHVRRMSKFGGSGRQVDSGTPTLGRIVHRDRIDFLCECQRLCDGFSASVHGLTVGQALSDIFGVAKPDWEKSSGLLFGNMAEKCSECQLQLGFIQRRHNCAVCGALVCDKCSSRDLIVYIPDTDDGSATETASAKLAVIKIIGCPETEPRRCRYLRVCRHCTECIEQRQIAEYQRLQRQQSDSVDEVTNVWMSVEQVNDKLRNLQLKIDDNLPKYRGLLEALDAGNMQSSTCPKHKSNMQVLAKSQSDLSDQFTQFVTTVLGVKRLKPITGGQMKVLRHIIQSKVDFYHENMASFRYLQSQLQSVIPASSLIAIQAIVDKNAINSCYVSVKQLIFEVIDMCDKHQLDVELVSVLVPVEKCAEQDLQSCLTDPWPDHECIVNDLLRVQLKTHRLLRRQPSSRSPDAVQLAVVDRVQLVLQQIHLQLVTKTSDFQFDATKTAVRNAVERLRVGHRETEWVLVD